MRRALLVVLIFLLGAPVAVLAASTAHACSCAAGEPEEAIARSDLVAEVSVRSSQAASPTGDDGRWAAVSYEVDVHRAWKGTTRANLRVWTAAGGSMCGVDLRPEKRYLLLATGDEDHWRTGLCSGTTPVGEPTTVNGVTTADVEEALGSGEPSPSPTDSATAAPQQDDGSEAPGAGPGPWVSGVALAALVLLALVRLRRSR